MNQRTFLKVLITFDNDGVLSKTEVLSDYENFADSQVTNWGDALKHDEF